MAVNISAVFVSDLSAEQQARMKSLLKKPFLSRINSILGSDALTSVVGGAIRDCLLNITPKDVDLACALPVAQIIEKLESSLVRCIPTGAKHLTVTAVFGNEHVQISSFRTLADDGSVVPVTGPGDVQTQLEDDLRLRDFRLNSCALTLKDTNKIYVPEGALEDLAKRSVTLTASAEECFSQDPLRILRLIRLAATHSLSVTETDIRLSAHHLSRLNSVSVERIRDELSRILLSYDVTTGLKLLHQTGALQLLLPEVAQFVGFKQNRFHKDMLWEHTLEVLAKTPDDLILRWAALLHDVGKPKTVTHNPKTNDRNFFKHESVGAEMSAQILKRLKYSNDICEAVRLLVQAHMRPLDLGDGGFRRLLRDLGDQFERWRILKEADASSTMMDLETLNQELETFDENIQRVKEGPPVHPLRSLAISGKEVIQLGVKEGPTVGIILRALHEQVLDKPEINTREELLKRAERLIRSKPIKERLS